MRLFARSVLTLLAFAAMAALAATKVGHMFPAMDTAAWVLLVAAFCAVVFFAIRLDKAAKRLPWRWINASENRREYIVIAAVCLLGALGLYLFWNLAGPGLAHHFGALTR